MHKVTFILLVIGGLNWLVFGIFNEDIGSLLGGMDGTIAMIIYILVGLSAIYEIFTHGKNCRQCKPNGGATPMGGM